MFFFNKPLIGGIERSEHEYDRWAPLVRSWLGKKRPCGHFDYSSLAKPPTQPTLSSSSCSIPNQVAATLDSLIAGGLSPARRRGDSASLVPRHVAPSLTSVKPVTPSPLLHLQHDDGRRSASAPSSWPSPSLGSCPRSLLLLPPHATSRQRTTKRGCAARILLASTTASDVPRPD